MYYLGGVYFLLHKKEKKCFKNELQPYKDVPFDPNNVVSYSFAEAATRVLAAEREQQEPTAQYIEDVIANIKIVLAIHKINFGQEGYDDPCFLLSVNQAELRVRIYSDFFILNKGSQEATSRLNVNDITQALKQIGVLKGKKGKKQFGSELPPKK